MNSKKLYAILVAALIIAGLGLFGSVYYANSVLTSKSSELVDLRASKQSKEQQEKQLVKAKDDIKKYSDLNEIAKSVVPQDKDQAKTVSEIVDLASQSGIRRLGSITFPPSTLGGVTKSLTTSKGLTQVTPVKGLPGVYELQITVSQPTTDPVSYGSFINFLSKLERNRRTAQVSSINVQPDAVRSDFVSFTLVLNEYIKP